MRHLIRFNESLKAQELEKIVSDYFAELIDENEAVVYLDEDDQKVIFSISIQEDDADYGNTIEGLQSWIDFKNKTVDLLEEVKIGVLRLKNDYPNLSEDFCFFIDELSVIFYLDKSEEGDFYKKRGDFVLIDVNKIKKILNLDKSVNISFYNDKFRISFANKINFEKYINDSEKSLVIDRYSRDRKYSKIFDKLTIDGNKIIDSISSISAGETETSHVNGIRQKQEVWYLKLNMNKKYKFSTIPL